MDFRDKFPILRDWTVDFIELQIILGYKKKMNRYLVIVIHLLYWIKVPYVYMIVIGAPVNNGLVFYEMLPNIANFTAFYIAYFLLVPHLLARKKFVQFGLAAVLGIVLSALVGWSVLWVLKNIFHRVDFPQELVQVNRLIAMLYLNYSTAGLFYGSLMKAFFTWYADIRVKEELKRKHIQTELALLKAQLNPHFLFNTLNNIDNLILINSNAASGYLNKLSGILRFTLYEAHGESIFLKQELDHIQQYIDLQRMRTSNERFICFEVVGQPGELTIAPMLFTPFIENAFKHSTNKKIDQAIDIQLLIAGNRLHFICSNVITESAAVPLTYKGGLGIELISNRLKLLYPEHELIISVTDERYIVTLKLELHGH